MPSLRSVAEVLLLEEAWAGSSAWSLRHHAVAQRKALCTVFDCQGVCFRAVQGGERATATAARPARGSAMREHVNPATMLVRGLLPILIIIAAVFYALYGR